jgi:aldose 1-epimerase
LQKSEFILSVTVNNTGKTPMPFGWGWHPYFKVQQGKKVDDYSLFLEATEQLATDAQMIPTVRQKLPTSFQSGTVALQKINLDTCFVLQPEAESIAVTSFYCEEDEYQMNIWQKNDHLQLNYLQIYTPPHRQSIAIEPQTCPANALNSRENLMILPPNTTWSTQLGVELQRL